MSFREQLIFYRKQRGFSQEQLGDQIGVSRQTISKWELGETTPELEKLLSLSRLFQISIDQLVDNQQSTSWESTTQPLTKEYASTDPESYHWEYKSKRTLFGLPLIHINLHRRYRAFDFKGFERCKAKGILAIGSYRAEGILSIALVASGFLSLGLFSAGILSLGVISVGLLLAVGVLSVGSVSFGSIAVGILAIGALAFGSYTIGAFSVGSHVAFGAFARGNIAIGDTPIGKIIFEKDTAITAQAVKDAILSQYPYTWHWLVDLFTSLAKSM
jgi:transcriptional regulator with XRE-family HTH domain